MLTFMSSNFGINATLSHGGVRHSGVGPNVGFTEKKFASKFEYSNALSSACSAMYGCGTGDTKSLVKH